MLDAGEGAVAQLGEHLVCNQGVAGSIPVRSIELKGDRKQEAGDREVTEAFF
jgi:hypothetical protein